MRLREYQLLRFPDKIELLARMENDASPPSHEICKKNCEAPSQTSLPRQQQTIFFGQINTGFFKTVEGLEQVPYKGRHSKCWICFMVTGNGQFRSVARHVCVKKRRNVLTHGLL